MFNIEIISYIIVESKKHVDDKTKTVSDGIILYLKKRSYRFLCLFHNGDFFPDTAINFLL